MINKSHRLSCRSCGSENLQLIFDLGYQPWGNNILTVNQIRKEAYYPLRLFYCEECELLQLDHTVPKEIMFSDHSYLSGTTETLKTHFKNLAKENIKQFNLLKTDLIVDIGGNDGTNLLQYKNNGCENLINIESSKNIAEISNENGISTICTFFNEETAKFIISTFSKAKLINASGVLFHLEELHSVLRGIKNLLDENGVFIIQFMYAGMIIEKFSIDMVYHEHLCYYTLKSLSNLLKQYDLEIFDAYFSEIHNGSIIAKVSHSNNDITKNKTKSLLDLIEKDNEYDLFSFQRAIKKIGKHLTKLRNLLESISDEGKTIYALGAPVKGNTLLNTMEIDSAIILKAFEKNSLKFNHFMPGSYIPIVEQSHTDLPDYFLLLSYNFEKEIVEQYRDEINNRKVKIIVPFPQIKIIENI